MKILLMSFLCTLSCVFGLEIFPTSQREYSTMTVTITCYFNASRCAQGPQWRGPALTNQRSNASTITNTTSEESLLIIENVQVEDEGDYTCICYGYSEPSNLDVLSFPIFDNINQHQVFFRGSKATIACTYPEEVFLIWRRQDTPYPYPFGPDLEPSLLPYIDQAGNLIIGQISNSDAGVYMCSFISLVDRSRVLATFNITVSVIEQVNEPLNELNATMVQSTEGVRTEGVRTEGVSTEGVSTEGANQLTTASLVTTAIVSLPILTIAAVLIVIIFKRKRKKLNEPIYEEIYCADPNTIGYSNEGYDRLCFTSTDEHGVVSPEQISQETSYVELHDVEENESTFEDENTSAATIPNRSKGIEHAGQESTNAQFPVECKFSPDVETDALQSDCQAVDQADSNIQASIDRKASPQKAVELNSLEQQCSEADLSGEDKNAPIIVATNSSNELDSENNGAKDFQSSGTTIQSTGAATDPYRKHDDTFGHDDGPIDGERPTENCPTTKVVDANTNYKTQGYEQVMYPRSLEEHVATLGRSDIVVCGHETEVRVASTAGYERVKYSQSLENQIAALGRSDIVVHDNEIDSEASATTSEYEKVKNGQPLEKYEAPGYSDTVEHGEKDKNTGYEQVKYSKSFERHIAALGRSDIVLRNSSEKSSGYERVKYSKRLEEHIASLERTDITVSCTEEMHATGSEMTSDDQDG